MEDDDRDNLAALLSYLVEHNREHSQELTELAKKATGAEEQAVRGHLLKAAQLMDDSTEPLIKVLAELG
ncbi:hypothetical protein ACFLWY_04790 [Chloroflexota bacterium]